MRVQALIVVLLLSVFLLAATTADEPQVLMGFSSESSRSERQWEDKFRAVPTPANLRNDMERLSARPHHYAPGQYTGYGVKTIPGVREATEQKKWEEADEQMVRAAAVLQNEAVLIESAAGKAETLP